MQSGTVTEDQLRAARALQAEIGGGLGKMLVKLGHISEKQLARAMSELGGIRYMDLSEVKLLPSLMDLLPRSLMEERLVIPIRLDHDSLIVAMAVPTDLEVLEIIRFDAGYNVEPVLALDGDIRDKLNHYYYDGKEPFRPTTKYQLSDLVKEIQPSRPPGTVGSKKTSPATTEQKLQALATLLMRKGVFTEQEFGRFLNDIVSAE